MLQYILLVSYYYHQLPQANYYYNNNNYYYYTQLLFNRPIPPRSGHSPKKINFVPLLPFSE